MFRSELQDGGIIEYFMKGGNGDLSLDPNYRKNNLSFF